MTIEVRPLGVQCNIRCQYCYQNPQRDAGNTASPYDLELIKKAVIAEGGPFSVFGGEPLLVPIEDLEDLWSWGFELYGRNGIQTNGSLIEARHIELFKRYRVGVGISIDGPDELNDIRWNGTLERTREATRRTENAIERLCAEGVPPSLIVTLHRGNAVPPRLRRLCDWVTHLDSLGVRSLRVHLLESESSAIRQRYGLTDSENIEALNAFRVLERTLKKLRIDIFRDMRNMLRGQDENVTCIWTGCDPYTTSAVRGIEGHGQRSNCGRTNKDGIDFGKADVAGYERYIALYYTSQADSGCSGCRFFLMCKGNCPGTAIDGDWRNRTEHCAVWKSMYETLETELIQVGETPISIHPVRAELERDHLSAWERGARTTMAVGLKHRQSKKPAAHGATGLIAEIRHELQKLRRCMERGA
jgi:radical SAM protein with 4Fe4S-binding SPASM domain